MDGTAHLLVLYLVILVINMGVAGVLWRQNRVTQHRDLFLSWAGWAISFFLQGLTGQAGALALTIGFGTSLLGNLPAGNMLAGIADRKLPVRALVIGWGASLGLAAVASILGSPFWLVCLPVALATAAPILYAVQDGLRTSSSTLTPAGKLLYLSATLFAMHQLDFPFTRMQEGLVAFGFTLAVLSTTTIAITAPAVLLEKSTAERVLAEEHNRMQSSFFANVSHELRTPLTLILSPLETLLTDRELRLPPHVREYLASMQRSTNRLLRLINNLLDLAKVDAGKVFLRYEPLDLGKFVTGVIPAFEPLATSKSLILKVEIEPTEPIWADSDRMDIVLQNLLANALKFTSAGGRVVVRVRDLPTEVRLEVEDTGIGIAEKDMKVIFDRFGQADASVTRRFGGSGIGLALVKDLVELHGGEVVVESVFGQGSTFRVRLQKGTAHIRDDLRDRRAVDLPVSDERRSARSPSVSSASEPLSWEEAEPSPSLVSQTGPRILVVEDNPDLRSFLRSLLASTYRVTVAVDGQEGLDLARETLPDLILSDVMMPRLSGYDLTRAVKSDPRTRSIPVILLTAKRGLDPALEGFQHGADDYLGKPFSTRELLARMKVHLDLRDLAQKLAELQKTAMMSTLAAGLAHEVRNPINAIVNGLPALRHFLPEREPGAREAPADALLRVLEDSANRIDRMIVELLDFTNLDRASFRDWDPTEGVSSTLVLLDHQVASGVRVVTDYQFRGTVQGRAGPLNQVVMNLLDNAFKALPNGGEVRIVTRDVGGGLELTVSDTGGGIAPEVLPRIFDPFFTTREVGVGTGLGLHLCKQIIQAHRGELDATSSVGHGATFRVWIPVTAPVG